MSKCRFSYIEQGDPISLQEFNNNSSEMEPGYHGFVDTAIQALLKVRLFVNTVPLLYNISKYIFFFSQFRKNQNIFNI